MACPCLSASAGRMTSCHVSGAIDENSSRMARSNPAPRNESGLSAERSAITLLYPFNVIDKSISLFVAIHCEGIADFSGFQSICLACRYEGLMYQHSLLGPLRAQRSSSAILRKDLPLLLPATTILNLAGLKKIADCFAVKRWIFRGSHDTGPRRARNRRIVSTRGCAASNRLRRDSRDNFRLLYLCLN
jgi:hypothetical protein